MHLRNSFWSRATTLSTWFSRAKWSRFRKEKHVMTGITNLIQYVTYFVQMPNISKYCSSYISWLSVTNVCSASPGLAGKFRSKWSDRLSLGLLCTVVLYCNFYSVYCSFQVTIISSQRNPCLAHDVDTGFFPSDTIACLPPSWKRLGVKF